MRERPGSFWLVVAAGLLVLVAVAAVGVRAWSGTSSDPRPAAGTPVAPAPAAGTDLCSWRAQEGLAHQQPVTGSGRRTVVIGDSYSVGYGLAPGQPAWPSQLPGQVQVFGYSGSGFSRGAGGCPGTSYAERAPEAMRTGPELVVVEGGLNDYNQADQAIRDGFRALKAAVGQVPMLVVGPPPAPSQPGRAAQVDAVLQAEAIRSGCRYLSMIHQRFSYLGDQVHLTPESHLAFGALVAAAAAE